MKSQLLLRYLIFIFIPIAATAQTNVFPSSGNVGIGTTTPVKKLQVQGEVLAYSYLFPGVNYDFSLLPRTQLPAMGIRLFDDYHTQRPGGSPPGSNAYGTLLAIYGRANHWQTDLYFGASSKQMYFRTSTWSGGTSESGEHGGFHEWRTILDSRSNVASSGRLQLTGSGDHYIRNGNLGIGTTTPQAKLAVNGSILAKEVKVKTDITVPDYVFDEDYQLPSPSELESYIKKHKHLPDVPSAAEIQKKGLDLAAMNLLLLKKIEELTLLLIEHDKKINTLIKANAEQ